MTIGGLDVGFADIAVGEQTNQKQSVNVMGNSDVYARNVEVAYRDYTYTLRRLSTSQKSALDTLIKDTTNWASGTLAIVDDDSGGYNGYYWGGKLKFRRRAGPFWTTTVVFRRFL